MAGPTPLDDEQLHAVAGGMSAFAVPTRGGEGADTLYANSEFGAVASGGGGDDLIYGDDRTNNIRGDAGNDTIDAGRGNDNISGGDGDDLIKIWFENSGGSDRVVGGNGTDTLQLGLHSPDNLVVRLDTGQILAPQMVDGRWTYLLPPNSGGTATFTSAGGQKDTVVFAGMERIQLT